MTAELITKTQDCPLITWIPHRSLVPSDPASLLPPQFPRHFLPARPTPRTKKETANASHSKNPTYTDRPRISTRRLRAGDDGEPTERAGRDPRGRTGLAARDRGQGCRQNRFALCA